MFRPPLLVLIIGALLTSSILASLAQPSEAEAKATFEKLGCIACHTSGGIAPPWDEVVSIFRNAAGRYASLDDFVRSEISERVKRKLGIEVKSWDELFATMAQLSGKQRGDPGVRVVESYLASLLGVKAETPTPETPKPTPTPTTTPTPTPIEAVRGEERLTWGVVLAVAAIVVIVLGALVAALIVIRR